METIDIPRPRARVLGKIYASEMDGMWLTSRWELVSDNGFLPPHIQTIQHLVVMDGKGNPQPQKVHFSFWSPNGLPNALAIQYPDRPGVTMIDVYPDGGVPASAKRYCEITPEQFEHDD